MELSFYSAASGVQSHQQRMNVISNNMANLNTVGYKSQDAKFQELLQTNMYHNQDEDVETVHGSGTRVEKTDTNFNQSTFMTTGRNLDFAIEGEGFFTLQVPNTEDRLYTRAGNFYKTPFEDGEFYLTDGNGNYVLSADEEIINITDFDTVTGNADFEFAITDFPNNEGILLNGRNTFFAVAKSGEPFLVEDSKVVSKYLEMSNASMQEEMVKVIEAQKAFQLATKMVMTSDEITQSYTNLRG